MTKRKKTSKNKIEECQKYIAGLNLDDIKKNYNSKGDKIERKLKKNMDGVLHQTPHF